MKLSWLWSGQSAAPTRRQARPVPPYTATAGRLRAPAPVRQIHSDRFEYVRLRHEVDLRLPLRGGLFGAEAACLTSPPLLTLRRGKIEDAQPPTLGNLRYHKITEDLI